MMATRNDTKIAQKFNTSPTQAKSISDYAAEALALDHEEAERAGTVGFMARAMVQATMPYSAPKETFFARQNGHYRLSLVGHPDIGLPYGPIPRLLMSWLTGEALKTGNRELILGNSLSDFMRQIGLIETRSRGGIRGTITALRKQMRRLFSSTVSCTYSDEQRDSGILMTLVDQYEVWWTPRDPEQQDGESTVTLSMPFFKEVRASPIPLRIDTLKVLRGSSQAIDLYLWLTYRNFYSRRESRIPWEALQAQFGAGYLETVRGKRNFKQNFLLALKKVGEVYPEAQKLRVEQDVLVYVSGFPDVAPKVYQTVQHRSSVIENIPKLERIPSPKLIATAKPEPLNVAQLEPEPNPDLLKHMQKTLAQAEWFHIK